ncbi:hypothetical protein V6N11_051856 [Hibiscus sabdariffa]|uniref:Uncharacterized protein n=1 Tax=Hibiscus sabdariffa TaxID=183260 RepID=A0ABR2U8W7_9ROSI
MFNKGAGHVVEERKLKVIYLSPPQPPSPVHEGSEEGSSPRGSVSDSSEFAMAAKAINERLEAQDISPEVRVRITKLTEEKNSAIQQSNKLRQELELMKRGGNNNIGGLSFMFVIVIGLIGIIIGYMMKS